MGENQILVAIKKPGELPGLEPLFENNLEAFQKAVGGYIEVVTVASDLVLICNEEGRLLNLPFNATICGWISMALFWLSEQKETASPVSGVLRFRPS